MRENSVMASVLNVQDSDFELNCGLAPPMGSTKQHSNVKILIHSFLNAGMVLGNNITMFFISTCMRVVGKLAQGKARPKFHQNSSQKFPKFWSRMKISALHLRWVLHFQIVNKVNCACKCPATGAPIPAFRQRKN